MVDRVNGPRIRSSAEPRNIIGREIIQLTQNAGMDAAETCELLCELLVTFLSYAPPDVGPAVFEQLVEKMRTTMEIVFGEADNDPRSP